MGRLIRDYAASPDEGATKRGHGRQFDVDAGLPGSREHESSIARSVANYRLATRVVLAIAVFFLLWVIVVLVLESYNTGQSSGGVILLSAASAMLGVFGSNFALDRWRGIGRERELSVPIEKEKELSPSEIAKYTRDLSSEDETRRLGALYFLATVARTSNTNARLIVPAIESFLQRALGNGKRTDNPLGDRRSADVQSALEFLGRLPARTRRGSGGLIRYRLDNLDLRGYTLGGFDFSAADLRYSILSGCVLENTKFDGADLRHAILQDVTAVHASFRGTLLERADCTRGFFVETDFSSALLSFAKFDDAVLVGAKLTGSVLLYSGIGDADLRDVSGLTTDINDVLNEQLSSSRAAAIALEDGRSKLRGS